MIPHGTLHKDYSVVIQANLILAVMPRQQALVEYPSAHETQLTGHLLTPGFVNAHGHAAMTLLRGVADDREMMDWLTNWIWPIEGQLVNAKFVYDGSRLAALEMMMSGTTCAAETYFFPESAAAAFSDMRMRAQVGMPVLQFGNAWAKNEEEHIHLGLAFRDSIKNSELLTPAFAPHSPYSVSDEGFEKVRLYSEQLDLPVHLHLHETATEISDAVAQSGARPIERMQRLGLITPALQAVHMTQLRDDEIALMADNGVQIAHCPESNMKLASGICRVAQLQRAGVNVAVGTDGAASNNDLDLLQEARSAALLSKIETLDATSLSAHDTLAMLTINGAKFLGLEDRIGSLEPGKAADMTATDLRHPAFQPIHNPISQLIYTASGRDVSHVWINGALVVENRQPQGDVEGIVSAANAWQSKIAAIEVAS